MAGVYLGVGEYGGMSSTLSRMPLYVRLCRGLNIKTRTGSKTAGGKIKKEERKDCIRVVLWYRWSRSAFPSAGRWGLAVEGTIRTDCGDRLETAGAKIPGRARMSLQQ